MLLLLNPEAGHMAHASTRLLIQRMHRSAREPNCRDADVMRPDTNHPVVGLHHGIPTFVTRTFLPNRTAVLVVQLLATATPHMVRPTQNRDESIADLHHTKFMMGMAHTQNTVKCVTAVC